MHIYWINKNSANVIVRVKYFECNISIFVFLFQGPKAATTKTLVFCVICSAMTTIPFFLASYQLTETLYYIDMNFRGGQRQPCKSSNETGSRDISLVDCDIFNFNNYFALIITYAS